MDSRNPVKALIERLAFEEGGELLPELPEDGPGPGSTDDDVVVNMPRPEWRDKLDDIDR